MSFGGSAHLTQKRRHIMDVETFLHGSFQLGDILKHRCVFLAKWIGQIVKVEGFTVVMYDTNVFVYGKAACTVFGTDHPVDEKGFGRRNVEDKLAIGMLKSWISHHRT